jgi:hypothetical protein
MDESHEQCQATGGREEKKNSFIQFKVENHEYLNNALFRNIKSETRKKPSK